MPPYSRTSNINMDNYSIAIIIVSSIWFLSEILINLLTRSKKSEAISHDQNSMGKIWIVIALSVTAGVFVAFAYPRFGTVKYFSGIALMIIGITLRLFTVFSLKSYF